MIIVVRDGQVVHPHALDIIIDFGGFSGLELLRLEDVVDSARLVTYRIHIRVHVGDIVVHVHDFIILLRSSIIAFDIVNNRNDVIDINDLAGLSRIGGPRLEPAIFESDLLDGARG